MPLYPFDIRFRFSAAQWAAHVCDAVPIPLDVDTRLHVDPAYFSNVASSDQSALCVSFKEMVDDVNVLTIVDAAAGWWRGIELPDRIVALAGKWHVAEIRIERNGNGAPDLLEDVINLRAQMGGVTLGRISQFHPVNKDAAKRRRIYKLQSLLGSPATEEQEEVKPAIRICRGPYVSALLEEAREFCFDTDENHRRKDDLLDVIALAAGF